MPKMQQMNSALRYQLFLTATIKQAWKDKVACRCMTTSEGAAVLEDS